MKGSFFGNEQALLTVMVQADNPQRICDLIDLSLPEGAEAFGMQFEQMKPAYRKKDIYRTLFAHAGDKPVYVTNYRGKENTGKTDEQLASELVELAECERISAMSWPIILTGSRMRWLWTQRRLRNRKS